MNPSKVIPGHIESGWELDAKADLAHNRKYLELFASKVTHAKQKPSVDELFETFKNAFPQVKPRVFRFAAVQLMSSSGGQESGFLSWTSIVGTNLS